MGLSEYDAGIITGSRALADFFDQVVAEYNEPKTVANWIMGEFLRLLNANNLEVAESKVKPRSLAALLKAQAEGTISGKMAKTVFEEMFETGKEPETIIKEKGMVQISDEGALAAVVEKVIAANPQSVEDYKAGKEKAIGFLVGQVMKETKGQANPGLVNKLLKDKLG
jgi:aspartyl-tRNA(Asn)/glutamyl-tRNA(Gln) amidotransferase subunit B